MSETAQQYIQRILGHLKEQNPLKVQSTTPKKIAKLISGKPSSKLKKRPVPEKWSVAEIVAHLADAELVGGYRIRAILGAPGTPIQAYDQDAWAAALSYGKRDARKSLALFRAYREANLELLKSLSPDQWNAHGMHAERGKETITTIVAMFAGHDINHLRQIENILARR